jgi:hypothetical protein
MSRWPYGPVTVAELSAGLVWPMLLRVPGIALQPPRVLLAVLVVVLMWSVGWVFDMVVTGGEGNGPALALLVTLAGGMREAADALLHANLRGAGESLYSATLGAWVELVSDRPLTGVPLLLLWSAVWSVGGVAISRLACVDLALNLNMTAVEGLRFALPRWRAGLFAILIPVIAMLVIALVLSIGGWALLSLHYLDIVGALFYGVAVVLGLVMVVLLAGFGLGQSLLLPAVAVESSDAMDAVQRAYAYVLGRTGRAALYLVIALAQWAVVYVVARWALATAGSLAGNLVTAWLPGDRVTDLLSPPAASASVASSIIGFWNGTLDVLLAAIMVSVFFTSGSVLYLLLRRINDEQDVREVWMPGVVAGTTASERG